MANVLCDVLTEAGYRALSAGSGKEAVTLVKEQDPDLLITDLRMSGMSGHQLQIELKRLAPSLPVVIITAFGSIPTAIESMKLGAFDYLTKPFGNDELLLVVSRALEDCKLRQEVRRLRSELARSYGLPNIIATDPKMIAVLGMIEQIADSSASVLITGESGTGKDLIARALHFSSARRDGPFIPINCAAIPEKPHRERTLRLRQRRVHRRAPRQDRSVRSSARRDPLSRRDWRDASAAPGQTAARDRRQTHPSSWRNRRNIN